MTPCESLHQHKVAVLLGCILAGNADSLIAIFSLLDTEGMEIDRTGSCTGFEVAGHVPFHCILNMHFYVLTVPDIRIDLDFWKNWKYC